MKRETTVRNIVESVLKTELRFLQLETEFQWKNGVLSSTRSFSQNPDGASGEPVQK